MTSRADRYRLVHAELTTLKRRPPTVVELAKRLAATGFRSISRTSVVRYARMARLPLTQVTAGGAPERIATVEEARINAAKLYGTYLPLQHLYQEVGA